MEVKTLFKPIRHGGGDAAYKFYLESPYQKDVRDFVDSMYFEVKEYLGDPNFEDMLQTDFHAAVWQLYVTWAFLKCGKSPLKKSTAHGPDITLEDGTIIEAVLVTRGTGADRPFSWADVEPISDSGGVKLYPVRSMPYPDPQIILRITHAIKTKIEQRDRWIQAGIVQSEQPFIIAVNAGLIDEAKDAYGGSYGARVAFALGNDVMVIPVNTTTGAANVDNSYSKTEHQPAVSKKSGNSVQSDLFLNDKHAHVSGLLFSPFHIGVVLQLGAFKDLEFVSNGFSSGKVPRELLTGVRYTWAEIDTQKNEYRVFSEPKAKSDSD